MREKLQKMFKIKYSIFVGIFFGILLLQIIFIPTQTFGEKSNFPGWLYDINYFWEEGYISDNELIAAIKYLDENNIITLPLHQDYDYKSNFLLGILDQKFYDAEDKNCEEGWYITGYFLPIESDYNGNKIEIKIEEKSHTFQNDFVNDVKTEGWGRTNDSNYLGWYSDEFHLNEFPLDSFGNELLVGDIAVDPSIIEFDTRIIISTLVEPWNEIIFVATDIGPSIKEKHIDVYTGEGKNAEKETYRITGYDNSVCLIN